MLEATPHVSDGEVSATWLPPVALDEDAALMCRVRDGDNVAFAKLWERHRRPIAIYLTHMVRHDFVAEELTQEVFLRVYRARHGYQPSARFNTWLFRIASHVGINSLRDVRKERSRRSLEDDRDNGIRHQIMDPHANVEEQLCQFVSVREIQEAILQLPSNQRRAVLLHKYTGCDYVRIAQLLGCSESAVKSLLFRAYQRLRVTLAHHCERRSD